MRTKINFKLGIVLLVAIAISACSASSNESTKDATVGGGANLANPASVYCEGLGYELELRSDDAGSYGVCIFPDGTECEEWDFLSGRCGQEHSYCVKEGFVLEEGANIGTCQFTDGSSCGELDFFEGRCGPDK